jgi:Anti-sigma factor NepR
MQSNGKNAGGRGDPPGREGQFVDPRDKRSTADSDGGDGHSGMDRVAKLDDSAQVLIGQHLKTVYGEIVEQPIPDQFLKLLEELERKEQER